MADPILLAKAAAAVLSDERTRKAAGCVLAAILSPLILLVAFFCALGSGTTDHNISAVELCFYGGALPESTPEEYRVCIEAMRASFDQLDDVLAAVQENTEGETGLDDIRVKAIFYALYFGAESHGDTQGKNNSRCSGRVFAKRRRRLPETYPGYGCGLCPGFSDRPPNL